MAKRSLLIKHQPLWKNSLARILSSYRRRRVLSGRLVLHQLGYWPSRSNRRAYQPQRNLWIVVHTDNQTTISALNKGKSRNPQVMQWLRSTVWLSSTKNFRITARYIPSKANTVAYAISRLHDPTLCRMLQDLFHNRLLAFDRQA